MSGGLRGIKRFARRTIDSSRQNVASIVDRLRRGERSVLYTPPAGMRLGNLLYLWLEAHHRSAEGADVAALESKGMVQWWSEFPALRRLTVTRDELRFSDRREWDTAWLYQRFGVDFTRDQLHAFIREVFAKRASGDAEERLVINVRRGDFYATEFEAKHGFDIVGYIDVALDQFSDRGGALVISDDPEWCRANLGKTLKARVGDVEYAEPSPVQNLLALASSTRLIGANSTFSYWGAYISDALHSETQIVMPRFHARMAHGSDAHQLDPKWIALDGFH